MQSYAHAQERLEMVWKLLPVDEFEALSKQEGKIKWESQTACLNTEACPNTLKEPLSKKGWEISWFQAFKEISA